jgi:hypothetical protein
MDCSASPEADKRLYEGDKGLVVVSSAAAGATGDERLRQHTSASVSIRQHCSASALGDERLLVATARGLAQAPPPPRLPPLTHDRDAHTHTHTHGTTAQVEVSAELLRHPFAKEESCSVACESCR